MDWVPIVLITFKVVVLGTVIYLSIKSHYDGEKQEQEEERARQNRIREGLNNAVPEPSRSASEPHRAS